MTKSSKTWWRRYRFRDKGVLPTPRLLWFFLIVTVPVLLAFVSGFGWIAFWVFNGVLLLASLLDIVLLPRRKQFSLIRERNEETERGCPFDLHLHLYNQSKVAVRFKLIDDLPVSFARPFPLYGTVSGQDEVDVSYRSEASVRGDYSWRLVYVRYRSNLGLWEKQMTFSHPVTVRVFPDLSRVRSFLGTAQQFLLHEGEKLRKKRVGSGEFTQVRTYVPGDDPRKMNWRQTAKRAELMTNVYEPEHGKQIVLLIDCGRTMGVEMREDNRLEYAMEAVLTVAAAALRQGDYVAVIAFSNRIKKTIPLGKGQPHLQTIIRSVYDLQYDPVESNVFRAFEHLETVQKRRSLILLFSDLNAFLFEETPLFQMQRIRRRHVFLLMSVADPLIAEWTQAVPQDTRTAMTKTMAQRNVLRRKNEMMRWERMGLQMVEVPEKQLASESLSRYIEIMNRGLL